MAGHVIVVLSILFVVSLASLWAYVDAKKNSSQSAFLWSLVVFFGGVLGILLYFLLGRDAKTPSKEYPFYDY